MSKSRGKPVVKVVPSGCSVDASLVPAAIKDNDDAIRAWWRDNPDREPNVVLDLTRPVLRGDDEPFGPNVTIPTLLLIRDCKGRGHRLDARYRLGNLHVVHSWACSDCGALWLNRPRPPVAPVPRKPSAHRPGWR